MGVAEKGYNCLKSLGNYAKKIAIYNTKASTVIVPASMPWFAIYESAVMSLPESAESRLKTALVLYAGGTTLVGIAKKKVSEKIFGISKSSSKTKKFLHDAAFGLSVNIPFIYGVYKNSGVEEGALWKATAAGGVGLFSALTWGPCWTKLEEIADVEKKVQNNEYIPPEDQHLAAQSTLGYMGKVAAIGLAITGSVYGAKAGLQSMLEYETTSPQTIRQTVESPNCFRPAQSGLEATVSSSYQLPKPE